MARKDPAREVMARLAELGERPDTPDAVAFVTGLLNDPKVAGPLRERAVRFAVRHDLTGLADEVATLGQRLFADRAPHRSDPGALAKLAVLEALDRWDWTDETLFETGIAFEQWDPAAGGRVEVAANVRARAASGLVRLRHPSRYVWLADLLFDARLSARLGAAQALAHDGGPAATALLRAKFRAGDRFSSAERHADDGGAELSAACLAGLLALAPETSWPLARDMLYDERPAFATLAAATVGETRAPEGFRLLAVLCDRLFGVAGEARAPDDGFAPPPGWTDTAWRDDSAREALVWALASLRIDAARDYVLAQAHNGRQTPLWQRVAEEMSWK